MSVLNQSGEEQVECPLCMEPLEVDDLHFYPCTCGYQICRFCWHRIRTDENGLCPACRKAYSENPADFIPLSQEQVAKIKAEKRQRDQQRKAKLSESRKHLATVRVVQKNLVFVVGLPMRLADPEILKRHEYFGKFGKIHKVVINQSTSYAGAQGPSASAYVTYMKSDDALRAIQSVNNIVIDGRSIKSSLGTTKYCSHFMKNQPCPKPDCMYLHDFGDPEASFTKEEMHAGKHQEYEKKLHDQLLQRTQSQASSSSSSQSMDVGRTTSKHREPFSTSPPTTTVLPTNSTTINSSSNPAGNGTSKDSWPHLNNSDKDKPDRKTDGSSKEKTQKGKSKSKNNNTEGKKEKSKSSCDSGCHLSNSCSKESLKSDNSSRSESSSGKTTEKPSSSSSNHKSKVDETSGSGDTGTPPSTLSVASDSTRPKLTTTIDDNSSFFSQNFQKITPEEQTAANSEQSELAEDPTHQPILTDNLPNIDTSEDWMAAFGFAEQKNYIENLTKNAPLPSNSIKDGLNHFTNGYTPFINSLDAPALNKQENGRLYDMFKPQDSSSRLDSGPFYKNGFSYNKLDTNHYNFGSQNSKVLPNSSSHNNSRMQALNNIDQLSRFMMDAAQKYNSQKKFLYNNGENGVVQNGVVRGFSYEAPKMVMQTQQEIEDQLLQLSLNRYCDQNGVQNGTKPYQPHLNGVIPQVPVVNGSRFGTGNSMTHVYQNGFSSITPETVGTTEEDELDFDPIHETQKAFAELIASEQNHVQLNRGHNSVPTNQMNGISHNHSGLSHIPPPPPGFLQPSTHMNSFGSKILPFLNIANSQQQQQLNGTTQNNWSNSYTQFRQQIQTQQTQLRPQQQQQQIRQQFQQSQHKNINNCHDWKTLDPAILSSSRHFALANMPPTSANFTLQQQLDSQQQQQQQQQQQNGGGPFRYFDYNNFSHINTQQNLNWFTSELNSQINSPPGFRNTTQTTKQQEC